MTVSDDISRRDLLGMAAATLAATVVPRHVLGGTNFVAPSDKLTVGYIGCGSQGLREMTRLVISPEIQLPGAKTSKESREAESLDRNCRRSPAQGGFDVCG